MIDMPNSQHLMFLEWVAQLVLLFFCSGSIYIYIYLTSSHVLLTIGLIWSLTFLFFPAVFYFTKAPSSHRQREESCFALLPRDHNAMCGCKSRHIELATGRDDCLWERLGSWMVVNKYQQDQNESLTRIKHMTFICHIHSLSQQKHEKAKSEIVWNNVSSIVTHSIAFLSNTWTIPLGLPWTHGLSAEDQGSNWYLTVLFWCY